MTDPNTTSKVQSAASPETGGRRVVAVIFLIMLGVATVIGASLVLQKPSGNIDVRFLRAGRFHGAWTHAGDPVELKDWEIQWTDVLFLVDGTVSENLLSEHTHGQITQQSSSATLLDDGPVTGSPVTGTMVIDGRRARFVLDTESDASGGTLIFEDPEPGIVAPGALENRILIDLEGAAEPKDDYLYLGFGRGKDSRVVKMLTFKRAR